MITPLLAKSGLETYNWDTTPPRDVSFRRCRRVGEPRRKGIRSCTLLGLWTLAFYFLNMDSCWYIYYSVHVP